jgi:hypothetical protein
MAKYKKLTEIDYAIGTHMGFSWLNAMERIFSNAQRLADLEAMTGRPARIGSLPKHDFEMVNYITEVEHVRAEKANPRWHLFKREREVRGAAINAVEDALKYMPEKYPHVLAQLRKQLAQEADLDELE